MIRPFAPWLAALALSLAAWGIAAEGRPAWIDSPNRAGYIGVVGYAAADGLAINQQRRIALTKARQELSRVVQTRIESVISQGRSDGDSHPGAEDRTQARLTSRTALPMDKARQAEEWVDPADRGLYLLLLIPENALVR